MYTFDVNLVSDLHKDAYGFRPDASFWATFAAFNPDQKQALWDSLIADLNRSIEKDEADQKAAIVEFEDRVDNLMHDGTTRKAVVQWLMSHVFDASADVDAGLFEYLNGLPFGYLSKMGYV